ncbi:MAG: DoxX family membrane protein [Desulfobacteraceae bacterium]|nr:DoxX family membrane protein [Desulfobacteraceae bacterium]
MNTSAKKIITAAAQFTLRIILGSVFVYASWYKIFHPEDFAKTIENYQLLPVIMINPTALLLPWIELVCGICLIAGHLVRGSALLIGAMLIIFIAAMVTNLFRGLDISCGCFSLSDKGSNQMIFAVMLDLALLAMTAAIVWRPDIFKTINFQKLKTKKETSQR